MNLKEIGWERGLDARGLCQVQVAGCEQGNGTSGSVKCGELWYWQRNCQLVRRAVFVSCMIFTTKSDYFAV